jgi:hypothetical protein
MTGSSDGVSDPPLGSRVTSTASAPSTDGTGALADPLRGRNSWDRSGESTPGRLIYAWYAS